MRFIRLREKGTCPVHGDGATVKIVYFGHPPMHVCYRCLDSAIEMYKQPLLCDDCGAEVQKGCGLEFHGITTPLCNRCLSKRLFGEPK